MDQYNVALKEWLGSSAETKGDEASIERPDNVQNVCWQTRPAPPTAYENALGDALQAIFAEGIYDLAGIVQRLNQSGVKSPQGGVWTEASFTAEINRLGG
jgi:hypothetical protein